MKTTSFILTWLLLVAQPAIALSTTIGFAGYHLINGAERPYTQNSGCWQSPTMSQLSAGTNPQTAAFVGIGGNPSNDGTFIQAGAIYAVDTNGNLDYAGFYELLPANIQIINQTTYPIIPGDIICTNITCATNCTASNAGTTWDTRIDNCRNIPPVVGAVTCASPLWTYTRTDTYANNMRNATWIMESLSNGSGVNYPYGAYGCIPFTNSRYNGHAAVLDISFYGQQMLQATGSGLSGATASVSNPSSTSDGFSVCWGHNDIYTTPPIVDPVYLPGMGGRKFK